jgi:catalase
MTPDQGQVLFGNTARAMADTALHIRERHGSNCAKADLAYGDGVAKALGLVKADAV